MKTFLISFLALALGVLLTTFPAHADTRADGAFLNRITNRTVTPHLDWARPLAGGAPKVLFIVPRKSAREVVELGQRLEMNAESVVAYNANALALDSIYETLIAGTGAQEKAAELAQKLNESYDAIVLANVDFNALKKESQFQILEKVSRGAGLLIVYPRALPNPKILSAPTTDWKQILQMADVATLPGEAARLDAAKLLKTYRFGQGRIATLSYPGTSASVGGGLSLTAFDEYAPSGWKARYENNMALVARTLLFAAGRDLSPVIQPQWPQHLVAGSGVLLPLQAQNAQSGVVRWRIRDEWNAVQASGNAPLQNGKIGDVKIPALAAGTHFFDVRLEQNQKIAAVGTFGFEVASPIGTIEISNDKESYERGENVAVLARLERPLAERAEVVARLEDLPNRNVWQRRLGVLPRGTQNIKLDFSDVKLPTIAGAIVLEIQRDKKTILKSERVAFFPRREIEIFPTLLWDIVPPYLTEMYAGQLIGNMNDPAGLTHPDGKGETARLTALVNQRFVPYMTRIGLSAGDKGQTITNQFLGMTKEEIEAGTKGEGSFYDPAVHAFWKKNIERRITGVPRVGPMIYTLGDENSFSYDAGYSPADNIEWSKYLQARYGSIAKLNAEWGGEYSRFEDVPHFSPQEMRDKRMFPAWYEHRRFMEKQYADVHHFLAKTIKEIDPHAIVGAEGSVPGELEQTISGLGFWGPYSDAVGDELLRSIGRDKLRMLWWGYGPAAVKSGPYALWRPLLQGVVNGSAWYSSGIESMGLLSVDLSFADYFQKLRPALHELDNGQAQTLIETPLKKDDIAILWSHASYSASFMDDRFFKPLDSTTAFQKFCYRNGLNFDFVTSKMAETGALENYKVLCLFGASALSEKEVAAIQAFAARGGIVIADINPGILSEYLRPLDKSRLADFFGAPALDGKTDLQLKPLSVNKKVRGQNISLAAGKVFQSSQAPVFSAREVGKGEAILLNFNLGSAQNTAEDKNAFDNFLLDLLKLANVQPQIKTSGLSEEQLILRVRQNADNQVIGVLADKKDLGKNWTLQLPRAGWIYEVNQGLLGHTATLQNQLDTPFKVFSVFDEKQNVPQLKLNRTSVVGGQGVLLDAARLSPSGIYRMDIFAPSGELLKERTKVFTLRKMMDANEIRFALSDARGRYRVVLTDVRTGLHSEERVQL
jgi:hypothetical protein